MLSLCTFELPSFREPKQYFYKHNSPTVLEQNFNVCLCKTRLKSPAQIGCSHENKSRIVGHVDSSATNLSPLDTAFSCLIRQFSP